MSQQFLSMIVVQFTDTRLDPLRQDTSADPELSGLREIIYPGWPEKQKQVPVHLGKYWACRGELSVENGLILKGERVVIPEAQRNDVIERILQVHQGFEKCRL